MWLLTLIYTITCSKISNIPYNLIFTTKFNDSSILITIISWDYLSLANEYVDEVTIPTQVIKYNHFFSRRSSQSDCNIHIKLNYIMLNKKWPWYGEIIYTLFIVDCYPCANNCYNKMCLTWFLNVLHILV